MRHLILSLFCFALSAAAFAGGTIRGTVIDDATGETLIGVNVVIEGTTTGTITDLDGGFSLPVDAGTHSVVFSYISYARQVVQDVEVTEGEVTVLTIRMQQDVVQTQEVVVTAKRIENSEAALLTIQKKSANVLDGISAETFARTGDGDAAEAIKRVTGVSVEGGKYVYVRGLGDRYTKTLLNGMEIPGLDPDRNTVQMDIFPSALLDNIVVYKTFTPDLPGDFTGGMVDIKTKDFQNTRTMSVSGSWSYNPDFHFQNDHLSYESSNADAFALGLGSRDVPQVVQDYTDGNSSSIPGRQLQSTAPQTLEDLTRSFDDELGTRTRTSLMDQSYGFSMGNQVNRERNTLGYNMSVGYSNTYRNYDRTINGQYVKPADPDETELVPLLTDSGRLSEHEVTWNALLNGSIKTQTAKHSLTLLHVQNGLEQAGTRTLVASGARGAQSARIRKNLLYYNQRSISNASYASQFNIDDDRFVLTHNLSLVYAQNKEPDYRLTFFEEDDQGFTFQGGNGGQASRIFRYLNEYNVSDRIDGRWNFNQWSGEKAYLKGGLGYTFKLRDFNVAQFNMISSSEMFYPSPDPDIILDEDAVFDPNENPDGTFVDFGFDPSNSYRSNMHVAAAYIMNELPLLPNLKTIYGLRFEYAQINYSGVNGETLEEIDNETVLRTYDPLPSVGFVYNPVEDMNLRLNYSRTLARPSFKEKSLVAIYDAATEIFFNGNIDLVTTYINNLDLRWEYFFGRGEMVSASAFYKRFQNPIEIGIQLQSDPDNITPRNTERADVFGAEVEVRKNFGFISEAMDDLSIGGNLTYVLSRVDRRRSIIDQPGNPPISEFEINQTEARTGEDVEQFRSLQGQAPFLVNTYLNYDNEDLGLEFNVSYNVQGRTLTVIGFAQVPSVYTDPFHSLNLKASKTFGYEGRWKASVTMQNLVGDERLLEFDSFGAERQVYRLLEPGRSFGVGISYNIR